MGRAEKIVTWLATAALCFAADQPALGQSTASLPSKVAAAVARDLQFDGDDQASQIQILAPAGMSLSAHAQLHVVSVRAGYLPESWLVRMDCADRADCLPFHVVLRSPASAVRNRAGDGRWSPALQSWNSSAHVKQLHSPLARSGDRMRLVAERPGMRLQARVVCLESGALGDAIRVRNLATHRVLLATIASKDEVRVE